MTFVFPILLGALILAGIPVLLHLLLRQKPKTVLFPAFRFLVKRQRTNLTKLRLRHLLLMALRMLLLAGIVLALAQPKIKDNPWGLPTDQAVAAIFIFDTSASMEYTVAASQTRLMDAQKRAVEMLKILPDNSEVVVLDSADALPLDKGEWLTRDKAAQRIGQLKLQAANSPVTSRVASALGLLARTATGKSDTQRQSRARVLCVFSDRTPASWDTRERRSLQALANEVPPHYDRLAAIHAGIAPQEKLLRELSQRLPAVGQSLPEQALLDSLGKLGERLVVVRPEEYPDTATQALIVAVRSKQQELLANLEPLSDAAAGDAKEYRDKLTAALRDSLRSSAGFTSFYVDVGVEQPADLALNDLQPIRELAANGNNDLRYSLRVEAQAIGDDFRTTLICEAGGKPGETVVEIRKGKRESALFPLDAAHSATGFHQVRVSARPSDQLPINNSRYLTYAFRRVLIVADADQTAEARTWAKAVEAMRFGAAFYRCEFKTPAALGVGPMDNYSAVFLHSVAAPEQSLWKALSEYLDKGGGVGIIPAAKLNLKAYNDAPAAQALLPGRLDQIVNHPVPGADWDWSDANYRHPFMHPFQEWRLGNPDFVAEPRGATQFWNVQPGDQSHVLVRYADGKGRPALLERSIDMKRGRNGRVLLFTSPPGRSDWNNYAQNSFFLTLVLQTIGYLSGDGDRPSLNFLSGQDMPRVPVPIGGQAVAYRLYREGPAEQSVFVGSVTVEQGQNEARVPQATEPGNYTLRTSDVDAVAWFSVNLPKEESDLAKINKSEIEAVLGPDAVLAMEYRTDMNEAMRGHVSRPWELMPILMLALLLFLAVENLLANKFYRKES